MFMAALSAYIVIGVFVLILSCMRYSESSKHSAGEEGRGSTPLPLTTCDIR